MIVVHDASRKFQWLHGYAFQSLEGQGVFLLTFQPLEGQHFRINQKRTTAVYRLTMISLAFGAAFTVAGASATFAQIDHDSMAMGEMIGAMKAYMDAMAKMNRDMGAMTMTGKPVRDFALMMIPHHQSAIDMARAYLASGENDPELVKLSNAIIAAQEAEIAFLKAWLQKTGH